MARPKKTQQAPRWPIKPCHPQHAWRLIVEKDVLIVFLDKLGLAPGDLVCNAERCETVSRKRDRYRVIERTVTIRERKRARFAP